MTQNVFENRKNVLTSALLAASTGWICRKKRQKLSKWVLFPPFVQPEGAASDFDIINKKPYKTIRFSHTRVAARTRPRRTEEDKQQPNKRLRLQYNFAY